MFAVLPLLVATVLQQMRHTDSSGLSGSPQSFGLNPKRCLALKPIPSLFLFLQTSTSVTSGLLLLTGFSCGTLCYVRGRAPPPHTETEWLIIGFTWETRGKQTSMQMEGESEVTFTYGLPGTTVHDRRIFVRHTHALHTHTQGCSQNMEEDTF